VPGKVTLYFAYHGHVVFHTAAYLVYGPVDVILCECRHRARGLQQLPGRYAYARRSVSGSMDSLVIRVETDKPTRVMIGSLTRELTSTLMGLKPDLELVPVGALPRQEKKTRRLIDERKF